MIEIGIKSGPDFSKVAQKVAFASYDSAPEVESWNPWSDDCSFYAKMKVTKTASFCLLLFFKYNLIE